MLLSARIRFHCEGEGGTKRDEDDANVKGWRWRWRCGGGIAWSGTLPAYWTAEVNMQAASVQ